MNPKREVVMSKTQIQRAWFLPAIFIFMSTVAMGQSSVFTIPSTGSITTYFLENIAYESNDSYYDVNNTSHNAPGFKYHHGVDIAGGGTIGNTKPVYACGAGKVVYIGSDGSTSGYGNYIIIYHGVINNRHVYSFYSHMGNRGTEESFITARLGQDVVAGTLIGRQGNSGYIIIENGGTGIHLDWEVRISDAPFINDALSTSQNGSLIWKTNHRSQTIAASPDYYTGLQLTNSDQSRATSVSAPTCVDLTAQSTWHPDGALILNGGTEWLIENGRRRMIPDVDTFNRYGLDFCRDIQVSSQEISCFQPDSNLSSPPARRLLKRSDGTVYLITDRGFKRAFTSSAVFEGLGYQWSDLNDATDTELAGHADDPVSPFLTSPFSEGTLIKKADPHVSTIYVISNGKKRGIASADAFNKLGYSWLQIISLPANVFDPITEDTAHTITDASVTSCGVEAGGGVDEFDPNLVITSHNDGQVVAAQQITLAGTATDAGRGNSGIASVTVGGIRATGDTAFGTDTAYWSKTITLNQGLNTITVIATDGSITPNSARQDIRINYQPTSTDASGPSLTINNLNDGQTVYSSSITVSGTATDANYGNNGIASVVVNGVRANGDVASGSGTASWSQIIDLNSGTNTITVVARDNSSNQNVTTVTITVILSNSSSGAATLATGLSNPNDIATDGAYVYWTDSGSSSVKKVSVNGGAVTTLFSGIYNTSGVALDDSYVYFGYSGDVKKVPKSGGSVITLASTSYAVSHLAVDSANVYWTSYGDGSVKKVPVNGGAVTIIATGSNSPSGITLADNKVYWTELSNPGAIKYVGVGGGSVGTLASNSNTPGIATDGTNIYWTENVFINSGKVSKTSIYGGTVNALASGLDRPYDVAVDATSAFWVEGDSNGAVKQVSLNGGTPITLASGLYGPVAIAIDSSSVYWIERSDGGSGSGTLKRVAKGVTPGGNSPTVTTTAAGTVTSNSATLGGFINPNGLQTNAWFEWGMDSTLSSNNNLTAAQAIGSGNTGVSVYADLSGLAPSATYYFRPVAANSAGTTRGAIQSFQTQPGTGSGGCSDYALETTISNLTQPVWLGVSGSKLFSTTPGKLQVIDLSSNTLSATIPFTLYPNAYGGGIAFLNGKAYIPLGNLGSQAEVAIVDTATNSVTGYIPVSAEPFGIAAYNGKLYVTHSVQWSNGSPSTVDVIDPNSNNVTATINAGVNTQGIAIVPSLNKGYAVNYVSATATVIDLGTNTVSGTISLPINPHSVVFAAGKIYIAGALINSQYGQVIVIDPATNSIATRIDVGRDPTGLAALNNRVFVTNQADRNLMIIDTDANTVIKTLPMGLVPTGVAVNPSTGKIYVANQSAPSIYVVACAPPSCTYTISSTSQSFAAEGGTGSVNVSAGNGCVWTATSNAGFLSVTSGSSGSGNGTVGFSVAANTDTSQRTGTITIAGQTFTVTQAPSPAPSPTPTPSPSPTLKVNVALASNGAAATASSTYDSGYSAAAAINGDRRGVNWGAGGGWNDAAPGNTFPDWLEVDFNGVKTIDEIDLFNIQDNYSSPSVPTETMTFNTYGLTGFDVQYWSGTNWVTIPGGNVTGNNKVWRKFTFPAITTSKIRVLTNASIDGWSRIIELEAWGYDTGTNVARSSSGAVANASSIYGTGYEASGAINGDRKGVNWGASGGWNDALPGNSFPDWLEVDFNGQKTIHEIDVFSVQDNYSNPSEPTETMTFSLYGLAGFDVQYWNGAAWVTIPGGNVTGNNKVWRKLTFSDITTTKVRVLTNASSDGYSRIIELEAWGYDAPPTGMNVALSSNGAVASASSIYPYGSYPASGAINGDRKGINWGSGGGWNDAGPANSFPDWLEVDFNAQKTIHEIDVFMVQDSYLSPIDPTTSITFNYYGLTSFKMQYWNGTSWADIPGASVTGNNLVWRRFNFSDITTSKIRVWCIGSVDGWSRVVELEAWGN